MKMRAFIATKLIAEQATGRNPFSCPTYAGFMSGAVATKTTIQGWAELTRWNYSLL